MLDLREGEDCIYVTSRLHYEGVFKSDKITGLGRMEYLKEGEGYSGDFFEGARHGQGVYEYKNK